MRTGVGFDVSDEQRRRLEVIAGDGNSKVKHARWARIRTSRTNAAIRRCAGWIRTAMRKSTGCWRTRAQHTESRSRILAGQDPGYRRLRKAMPTLLKRCAKPPRSERSETPVSERGIAVLPGLRPRPGLA